MSNPLPTIPPAAANPAVLRVDAPASTWDRISSWVSENKAVVYTIAGVAVVVTGAGVVYYLNSDSVRISAPFSMALRRNGAAQLAPRAKRKERRANDAFNHRHPRPAAHPNLARRSAVSAKKPNAKPPIRRKSPQPLHSQRPPASRAKLSYPKSTKPPSKP